MAVVVIGEEPYAEGMGDIREWDQADQDVQSYSTVKQLQPYGSTLELSVLHPEDLQVIKTLKAKGLPVVAVLISGRPLVINRELAEASAFVAAWLPGSEGQGVADVLFGDADFQGRLSYSWPRTADDNLNRCDEHYEPLFPFGYGLSLLD